MNRSGKSDRLLVYGAGVAGRMVTEELDRGKRTDVEVLAFVDDDPAKSGQKLLNRPIEPSRRPFRPLLEKYGATRVLLAMPSVPGRKIEKIHRALLSEEIPTLIIPSLSSIVSGRTPITIFRNVNPIDFMRRRPRALERGRIAPFLKGQRVLVTGAAGSIGCELTRQLRELDVAELHAADRSEIGIYQLQEQFRSGAAVQYHLTDLSEPENVRQLFKRARPTVIFHAAAYKHVPILENIPEAAVLNNVQTTRLLAETAIDSDVHTFLNISTDKAIQPSSVMGASKRLCEMLLQAMQPESDRCRFLSVRFGNVMGSSGSVFLKFMEQIERGGPVTVSDPNAQRHFMLTTEAVELVLLTACIGKAGKIYVLDMGEPVKILDLARDLIRFHGRHPDLDIRIMFTGLQPGEKLIEDLSGMETRPSGEDHVLEVVLPAGSNDLPLDNLVRAARRGERDKLLSMLRRMVPDYAPKGNTH